MRPGPRCCSGTWWCSTAGARHACATREFAADRAELEAYLSSLGAVTVSQFEAWPRAERLAFLINAYNAHMVQKVLTRYPDLRSVWDFGRLFGNPFKDAFFTLLGQRTSLDGIEQDMLRKPGAYDEPRVHFALNCASVGCPMLREEAYVGARLEAQLEDQARRFLSDRSRNRYDPSSRTARSVEDLRLVQGRLAARLSGAPWRVVDGGRRRPGPNRGRPLHVNLPRIRLDPERREALARRITIVIPVLNEAAARRALPGSARAAAGARPRGGGGRRRQRRRHAGAGAAARGPGAGGAARARAADERGRRRGERRRLAVPARRRAPAARRRSHAARRARGAPLGALRRDARQPARAAASWWAR